jgi:hypothetical protein
MTFTPDSDVNYQAYLYARGGAPVSAGDANLPQQMTGDDLAAFDQAFIQWVCTQMTAGTTLVTNGGTRTAPTQSIAAAINAAISTMRIGNRSF